jgi:hypothetical protein
MPCTSASTASALAAAFRRICSALPAVPPETSPITTPP